MHSGVLNEEYDDGPVHWVAKKVKFANEDVNAAIRLSMNANELKPLAF